MDEALKELLEATKKVVESEKESGFELLGVFVNRYGGVIDIEVQARKNATLTMYLSEEIRK